MTKLIINLMGCFSSKDVSINNKQEQTRPRNRVSDQDKAILDVKTRLRTLRNYIDKMNVQKETSTTEIKDLLRNKQKAKAVNRLKISKMIDAQISKAEAAKALLDQTII